MFIISAGAVVALPLTVKLPTMPDSAAPGKPYHSVCIGLLVSFALKPKKAVN